MNLAVKLYADDSNPSGIPGVWPSQVRELGSGTSLPDNSWQLMTHEEYETYRQTNIAAYNAWESSYEAAKNAVQVRKDGIKKRMKYGQQVIEEFRYLTLDLPDSDGPSLIGAFAETIALLNLGMLAAAAETLGSISGVDILSAPFDFNDIDGPTVQQHFISLIQAGDTD